MQKRLSIVWPRVFYHSVRSFFVIKIPDNPNKNNPAPIGRNIAAISYGAVAAEPSSNAFNN